MYVLGIDAGGTKTHAAIGDENGAILAEGFGGSANYQCCGIETTCDSLTQAIEEAFRNLNRILDDHDELIMLSDLSYAVFGMSGADDASDLQVLNHLIEKLMGKIPFEVKHDAWIGLCAATEDYTGIVSICGTGAGHAGRNQSGQEIQLRNLDYMTGNFGGGGELLEEALHYAFRSEEETGEKTSLETVLPAIFQTKDMQGVCDMIRNQKMTDDIRYRIPIAVFEEAHHHDAVCCKMLSDMGRTEGEYAVGLIRRLGMEHERVPMVLIGSLFRTREPLLIDAYMEAVHRIAPEAYPVILDAAPVTGAVRLAAGRARENQESEQN